MVILVKNCIVILILNFEFFITKIKDIENLFLCNSSFSLYKKTFKSFSKKKYDQINLYLGQIFCDINQ
jgi:hypothetical protein